MRLFLLFLAFNIFFTIDTVHAQTRYLGQYSVNQYMPDSTSNPYGRYGNQYSADSINNPYGAFGNEYSPSSARNRYAIGDDSPKLYDSQGNFRGNLNNNPYDPDSIANPYGRYGSQYSAESINNPYGAGSQYLSDSPNNPYGTGWAIRY